ncbi:MAG: hypothetical protein AB1457_16490 [Chloroflexota bacterium]
MFSRPFWSGRILQPINFHCIFNDIFDRYQREVVEPRVAAAGESCAPHPAPRRGMIEVPVNVEEGFIASDWEILGGEYFARKEWSKEDAANGLIEAGTLKLYHRPGQ